MGAGSSLPANPGGGKLSLYAIIGVDRTADADELKRAYRKAALRLHPDKNVDGDPDAVARFAQLQAAYDILKDPQERSYYDNKELNVSTYEYTSKTTSADQLRQLLQPDYVNKILSRPDLHEEVTFLFETLKNEELEAAFENGIDLGDIPVSHAPPFGGPNSKIADVTRFYDFWSAFATRKSFSWVDALPVHHTEDRKMRRAMEGHNKKLRDAAKRDYNNTVRRLVAVVRTNDTRVKPSEQPPKKATKRPKDRARTTSPPITLAEQEAWTKLPESSFENMTSDVHLSLDSKGHECIVCEEIFESTDLLLSHELTPGHRKLLKKMQNDLRQEDALFMGRKTGDACGDHVKSSTKKSINQQSSNPIHSQHEMKEGSVEELLSQLDNLRLDRRLNSKVNDERLAGQSKKLGKAKLKKLKKQQYTNT